MRLKVDAAALKSALSFVRGRVPVSSASPILQNVLLATSAGHVAVTANHLEREAETMIPAEIEEEGAVTINSDVLHSIAKKLSGSLSFQSDEGKSQVTIRSDTTCFKVRVLPAKLFPKLPSAEEDGVSFTIRAAQLCELLRMTCYACDVGISGRAWAAGVLLYVEGKQLCALASDTLRMAKHSMPLPEGAGKMAKVILPAATAKELVRTLWDFDGLVYVTVNAMAVEVKSTAKAFCLRSRVIKSAYPINCEEFINSTYPLALTVNPVALAEALERVTVVNKISDDKYLPTTFEMKEGRFVLRAGEAEGALAKEEVRADVRAVARFNMQTRFLQDLVVAWPTSTEMEVQFEVGRPIVFCSSKHPELRHLIMPVR